MPLPSAAQDKPLPHSVRWLRHLVGAVVGAIAVLPLLVMLFGRSPYYISSEFIAYRFGESMKLRYGESSAVRPVQGLPTALLSRAVLAARPNLGAGSGISRSDLDSYARTYALGVAGMAVLLAVLAWRWLPWAEASAVSLLLVSPWYVGVASMALFLAPEYWIGEWLWLCATLLILAKRSLNPSPGPAPPIAAFALAGAWVALGAAIKVSLLGAAPLVVLGVLFPARPKRLLLGLPAFLAAALVAYGALAVLYMGSIAQGWELLKFQLGFFRDPNRSAQYASWRDALQHKPEIGLCVAIALAMALGSLVLNGIRRLPLWRPLAATASVSAWIVLYVLMVARRPHNSTLTSVSLSAMFLAAYPILLFPVPTRRAAAVTVALLLFATAAVTGYPGMSQLSAIWNTKLNYVEASDRLVDQAIHSKYAIWFVPTNYWNAVLIPQLLGYNGALGHYAVYFDSGHLSYRGKGAVFLRLWPNTYLIGADAADFDNIKLALAAGATVYYTKPPDSADVSVAPEYSRLVDILREAGCRAVEEPVCYNGQPWLFGHSVPRDKG